jgi:SAM-dependent methyltransferase
MTTERTNDEVRSAVRAHYGQVAEIGGACGGAPGCCVPGAVPAGADRVSLALGYTEADLQAVPEGADLGLGCGNPQAIAALRAGETVLDLGSGGGFDAFLAARRVGPSGRVLGVDMTPAMLSKARANAAQLDARNVEFRLGEIERLPVADASVDVILSNCVINLSPDKPAVFREAWRVLRPGGRLAIADVVLLATPPAALRASAAAFSGCVTGAATVQDLRAMLTAAGFASIRIEPRPESRTFIAGWLPGSGAEDYVASATIEAIKPAAAPGACCGTACCTPGRPA